MRKGGAGDQPTIKVVGSGSAFCILQQADSLTVEGIHFDLSDCKEAVSYFGLRTEWDAQDTKLYNCTWTKPKQKNFDDVYSSRIAMTVKMIDVNAEYSNLTVTGSKFYNIKMLSFEEKASGDSTIYSHNNIISALSAVEVSP